MYIPSRAPDGQVRSESGSSATDKGKTSGKLLKQLADISLGSIHGYRRWQETHQTRSLSQIITSLRQRFPGVS